MVDTITTIVLFFILLFWFLLWKQGSDRTFKAHNKFRSAFFDILHRLRALDQPRNGTVHRMLKAAYPTHEAAYFDYRRSLGPIKRHFLDKRWISYRGKYQSSEMGQYEKMYRFIHLIGKTHRDEVNKRNLAIKLIEDLIS